ncbi:MAG: YabP/YqfC family sporulation protein [Clostridia bacterium]|nr:YabP/YqfC family sporulation protein [Clostridia bacterium]
MSEQSKMKKEILNVTDRDSVEISGVDAILSFEDDYIDISTTLGKVSVEGSELKVLDLSKETCSLSVKGKIKAVLFSDISTKKKRGLFG